MKKYFYLFIILLVSSNAFADINNYKSLSKIEMDVFRNGEKILPLMAVYRRVVWLLSEVLRNFVEIVKNAKHKAAKKGKITA